MSDHPLKTVLVGFGAIAEGLGHDARMAANFRYATHAQVLADHPGFDWCAVVDPDADARARAAADWDVAATAATIDGLDHADAIEAAVIATPPGQRLDVLKALANLKAVMIEKPLGAEGAELVDHCQDRDIRLQVNFWRRGDELTQRLAVGEMAARIGDVQACFATYGNGLMNNASHLVDLLRLLLGEISATSALAPAKPAPEPGRDNDWSVSFSLTFATGVVATVQPVDFRRYREIGVDLWGTEGRLSILQEGLTVAHYPCAENRGLEGEREIASDRPETLEPTVGHALYRLYDNLAGSGPLLSTGASALETERLLTTILDPS